MAPRLKEKYDSEIRDQLLADLGVGNVMRVPRLQKIIVNMGAGDAAAEAKLIDGVVADLRIITGQQPRVNRARRSVSNFKVREGQPIGAHVTLRGERMWEFFDRLVALAIPRIRDFRGLNPGGFDGRGNYSFGVTEQLIFPEIDYDKVQKVRGMDITLVTSAETDDQGKALLDAFGFPFRQQQVGA
jgi:large subunit ribosomal protein L5